MSAVDVFRVFNITLGCAVIITTITIVLTYFKVHHHHEDFCGPRFLPHHIATIGASFVLLAAFGIAEIGQHFGRPLTWHSPVLFIAFSLANVAQAIMLSIVRVQRKDEP